ncbi:MAG TPA: ABC transporter substrate-binding protein [Gammaproteobacteria bacterium]|nr:ABC transporter substrate-binding protein [Gammaproteobacteria bacterium]
MKTAGLVHALVLMALTSAAQPVLATHISASEMVRQTTQKVITILRSRRAELEADPRLLYRVVEREVAPYFDFVRMSRLVLGKYWRRATPAERRRFAIEFRKLLVRSYASSMLKNADGKISYLPMRARPSDTDVTVRTEVELPDSDEPVEVDYSLYLKKGEWKVYDVTIGGVSLVVNYRTSFADEIRKSGSLAGLIEKLRQRNEEMLHG